MRDVVITAFIIPVILGAVQLGRIINTIPQVFWWVVVILFSLSLFFINLSLPSINIISTKKQVIKAGRIDHLSGLIKETRHGSQYSGQSLSLILVNLYLKDCGEPEINIHKLEDVIHRDDFPREISDFVKIQFDSSRRRKNSPAIGIALERAVDFLSNNITGERRDDRSTK